MKRLAIVVLAIICLAPISSAQDWKGVNRDDFGNIVRGAYLTNEWFDNWYISATGGVATCFSQLNDARITPQFDFSLLKWFTPCIGARVGYMGFTGEEHLYTYTPYQWNHSSFNTYIPDGQNNPVSSFNGPGTLSYGMGYIHGDLLWNVINTIWGYRYDRFFNISPYAHAGLCRLFDNNEGEGFNSKHFDNELAFGFGLYNTFRITERIVGIIDLRAYNTASRYKTYNGVRTTRVAATAGIGYNIYKTYWNRAHAVIADGSNARAEAEAARSALSKAESDNDALKKAIADKEAEIAAKNAEIADKDDKIKKLDDSKTVQEIPYTQLVERANAADLVLYYYINVDKLNFSELRHLDEFVQSTLKEDPNHVFYLTGSADKGTGTFERNTFLCRSRAYKVRDILIGDYGVKPENVVIKATLISDKHLDGALDRCVLIESK